jgi:chromosome segregation ATPase
METLNNLVKVEKERKEVETILAELEAKLKTVFQSKEEFEAFEKDNQNRKKRTGKEINARLADLSNRLITVKQEHLKAVKEIDSIGQYKQTSNDELMEVKQRAKLLTDKIIFYSSEVQHAKTDNIQLHR